MKTCWKRADFSGATHRTHRLERADFSSATHRTLRGKWKVEGSGTKILTLVRPRFPGLSPLAAEGTAVWRGAVDELPSRARRHARASRGSVFMSVCACFWALASCTRWSGCLIRTLAAAVLLEPPRPFSSSLVAASHPKPYWGTNLPWNPGFLDFVPLSKILSPGHRNPGFLTRDL